MTPGSADLLGYLAAFCTTVAFVPQAWQVYRTRSTADLSLGMFLTFSVGVALWLLYGVAIGSTPVIVANVATLLLAGYILAMKLTEKRRAP
ncbi:MAG: SemiSWEET transporter [Pseudomonadota bacterium]